MKPTQEQRKEFWDGKLEWWNYPDGSYRGIGLPEFDLNNLLGRWRLSNFITEGGIIDLDETRAWVTTKDYSHSAERSDKDPALALFWALDKVRKNEDTES